ncbi:uncharacterized protein RJT20DRAFT_64384 [Scheffersomyces xylosifermentans]|uniref:uncharacterized protein n=1 Tax=Scheffersomyces xylosifermentans TaxID=1304137 RepID=UPI00315DB8DF
MTTNANIEKCIQAFSRDKDLAFMLVTSSQGSEVEINSSPHYDHLVGDVGRLFERSTRKITTIVPATNRMYNLTFSRSRILPLMTQYRHLFCTLTQDYCKLLAKKWIKLIEPRKQSLHPYKDSHRSRPKWWPETIPHIEPDHLSKDNRIKLLTSIIRNPTFNLKEMKRISHSISYKYPVAENIVNEIFYLAAYDQLFYNQLRNCSELIEEISLETRTILKHPVIHIPVSLLSWKSTAKSGMLMMREIQQSDINVDEYFVKPGIPSRRLVLSSGSIRRKKWSEARHGSRFSMFFSSNATHQKSLPVISRDSQSMEKEKEYYSSEADFQLSSNNAQNSIYTAGSIPSTSESESAKSHP